MSKFFVEENQVFLKENKIILNGDDVNHIKNVLRYSEGEGIIIAVKSNNPKVYDAKIKKISENIECSIIGEIKETSESNIDISVYQGIPKLDKMEYIIQKCTELGVKEITPLELNRCIVKIEGKDISKKQIRWQKIAEAAAKQSQRDIIPKIGAKIKLNDFCKIINNFDLILVAYEKENELSLKEVLKISKNAIKIAILIGPEGGFEQNEIELLKNNGANIVSLGNRILRTETAPIVLSSILMYEYGELNRKG